MGTLVLTASGLGLGTFTTTTEANILDVNVNFTLPTGGPAAFTTQLSVKSVKNTDDELTIDPLLPANTFTFLSGGYKYDVYLAGWFANANGTSAISSLTAYKPGSKSGPSVANAYLYGNVNAVYVPEPGEVTILLSFVAALGLGFVLRRKHAHVE